MSQNIIKTTSSSGPVQVCAGWDNPLKEVFCSVFLLGDIAEAEEEMLFIGTEEFTCTEDVKAALKTVGIVLPATVVQAIQSDIDSLARNIVRRFSESGVLEKETSF